MVAFSPLFSLGQASQGFEGISTTLNCGSAACLYTDPDAGASPNFLRNNGGIPVRQAGSGSTLGFLVEFTDTRGNDGLDDDAFGVATSAQLNFNIDSAAAEGSQAFIMADVDGTAKLFFDYVDLTSTTTPQMSVQYRLGRNANSGSDFETEDRFSVKVEIDNCASTTSISLLNGFGSGANDIDNFAFGGAWKTLVADLSAYVGCRAQLIIEFDVNSISEEVGIDNVIFTEGTRQTFDPTAPPVFSISSQSDIVRNNDAGNCSAVVTLPTPSTFNATGAVNITSSVGGGPGSSFAFPVGTTNVIYTATDAGSGQIVQDNFNVTVNDTENPSISCPANIVVDRTAGTGSAVVNLPTATTSDNCPGVGISVSPPSGSAFPIGNNTVTFTATDAAGNQASCTINVIVQCTNDTTNVAATTCDPAQVGVRDTVFTNQFGCDSLIITTTTLLPSDTTNVAATTCDPAQVGVRDTVFTNKFGCDSLIITTTTLLPSDTTNIAATTCDPAQVGVRDTVFTNKFGCDSLIITTTTLLPSDTTNVAATTCDPAQVGVRDTVFTNKFGCDSLIITTTTLLPSDTTNVAATTCDPAQVGVRDTVFTNKFGCDSLIITTTTLLPSDTTNVAATTCDITQVGLTQQVFTNQFGCDSLVITTTTLLPSDTTHVAATTCDTSEVGINAVVLTNQFGCDSTIITTTTLLPSCIKEFILVDAHADTNVVVLTEGACLLLQDLPEDFNIIAVVEGTEMTDRVVLDLNGPVENERTERKAPYAVFGDNKGNYTARPTEAGMYDISATPFFEDGGLQAGTPLTVNFKIIDCAIDGPSVSAGPNKELDCNSGEAMLMGSFNGGTGTSSVSWAGPNGFNSTELMPTVSLAGLYTLTVTDSLGCSDTDEVLIEPCPIDCDPQVSKFILVNSKSDTEIRELSNNDVIDLTVDGNDLNIIAEVFCEDEVESVKLELTGAQVRTRTENKAPYALAGDVNGDYRDQEFIPGSYTIKGTPFPERNAQGSAGIELIIDFTVINGNPAQQSQFGDPSLNPDHELSVYPVPADQELFIDMKLFEEGVYEAQLFDVAGRAIMSQKMVYDEGTGKRFSLNTQSLAAGVYLLRVAGQTYQEWRKVSIRR